MTHRIIFPVAALALSGCGLVGPPPTGHVEGQVNVCIRYGSVVEPFCEMADTNVDITLEGAGPTETATLESGVFRFDDVEVGNYTLYAAYIGEADCLVVFEQTTVTVAEDQTANVVIDGRGRC